MTKDMMQKLVGYDDKPVQERYLDDKGEPAMRDVTLRRACCEALMFKEQGMPGEAMAKNWELARQIAHEDERDFEDPAELAMILRLMALAYGPVVYGPASRLLRLTEPGKGKDPTPPQKK